jgi:hypothetical protein
MITAVKEFHNIGSVGFSQAPPPCYTQKENINLNCENVAKTYDKTYGSSFLLASPLFFILSPPLYLAFPALFMARMFQANPAKKTECMALCQFAI